MAYSIKTIVNNCVSCRKTKEDTPVETCEKCEWHDGYLERDRGNPVIKCKYGMEGVEQELGLIKEGLCPKCKQKYNDDRIKSGKHKGHGMIWCPCGWRVMI